MVEEEKEYKVKITQRGKKAYFDVLDYVFEYYSEDRAYEIAEELLDYPNTLKTLPNRGKLELALSSRKEDYRYILYKRTQQATVKVVYYVDDITYRVYVTDFFPTEMNQSKIRTRS